MKPVKIAVAGCCGRMGRAIVRLAALSKQFELAAAFAGAQDPNQGKDAGVVAGVGELGIPVRTRGDVAADVLIEFTNPRSACDYAGWCAESGIALVSGTTGLNEETRQAHRTAAQRVPVVWSPNMSVGVNILLTLVRQVASTLGEDWDVEISETHHRHKADAPSGTARALLEAVCAGRHDDPRQVAVFGREGIGGGRNPGQIGVHALRMGEVVGDHDVHFASSTEILTLTHRAQSRDTFAVGSLRAAEWVAGRVAGLYSMKDVLSLA
ncbi:MAG: 4-hydroxy-tetrahydrodipicolinate reductase [Phycisphaerae bacterium]